MNYKFTNRNIHRDVAYFYVGLILAFSLSGIILNHRQSWYPMEYAYDSKEVRFELNESQLDEETVRQYITDLGYDYSSHRARGSRIRVDLVDGGILEADLETKEAVIEYRRITPLIGHTMKLHKDTNGFWIWYSDIFGAAMILICITGMLIPIGKKGFGKRGWKLAIAGMVFPLIFLLFF